MCSLGFRVRVSFGARLSMCFGGFRLRSVSFGGRFSMCSLGFRVRVCLLVEDRHVFFEFQYSGCFLVEDSVCVCGLVGFWVRCAASDLLHTTAL